MVNPYAMRMVSVDYHVLAALGSYCAVDDTFAFTLDPNEIKEIEQAPVVMGTALW